MVLGDHIGTFYQERARGSAPISLICIDFPPQPHSSQLRTCPGNSFEGCCEAVTAGEKNLLSPLLCPAQLDGWIHEKMLMARDGTREDSHKLHKRWLRHQAFMAELAQNKEWLEKIERVRKTKPPALQETHPHCCCLHCYPSGLASLSWFKPVSSLLASSQVVWSQYCNLEPQFARLTVVIISSNCCSGPPVYQHFSHLINPTTLPFPSRRPFNMEGRLRHELEKPWVIVKFRFFFSALVLGSVTNCEILEN